MRARAAIALGHALALALVLALPGARAAQAADMPEPEGLWDGPMRGETPETLAGATVIDVDALAAMLPSGPLLIDSGPAPHRPENLPADTVWAPTHRSIPGAAWFPGAGRADLPQEKVAALLAAVDALAGGAKDRVIVSFCEPQCWGSWNLGKRLVEAGYTAVHWLPAGVAGWQERHETAPVEPAPGWAPPP